MQQQTIRYPVLAIGVLAGLAWVAAPIGVGAETAGSYAHPGISGPMEGIPGNPDSGKASAPETGGSAQAAPSTRTEGSASRGFGPGAHRSAREGRPGKGAYDKNEGSGKKESRGYAHGQREGSAKNSGQGYGHHESSGPKYGHSGHGYAGHGGHFAHRSNPYQHILKFRDKLGLTDQQVSRVRDMQFDWEKQRIKLGADLMIAHMELDRLVHSGTLDEARMQNLAKVIGGLKLQEAQIMVESKISLLKLMTEEQRKKIAEIHGDH